MGRITLERI